MNNIITKISIYAVTALAAAFCFTACKDEPDRFELADGKPTVYYVRPQSASAADSLLTGAYMGNGICLVGDNLRSVYKLMFNDQEAVLNNSFITDHTLLVSVPSEIPGEVSNLMYLITKNRDTVKYDFKVLVPSPVIYTLSNEYAPAGSTVTLRGDYFVDDPNVPLKVYVSDEEATVKSIAKTAVSFVMPDVEEGIVKVTNIYGEATSSFHYKDSRGMLFTFDNDPHPTNHGWHNQVIESDETSQTGKFLRLGGADVTMVASGAWDDNHFSFEYWPGNWADPETYVGGERLTDYADFSDWKNMSLKFEMFIPRSNPWKAGSMQLLVGGVDKVSTNNAGVLDIYGNVLAGCNNTYFNNLTMPRGIYAPWYATGSFDTADEWLTVTLPYSEFIYGRDGNPVTGGYELTPEDFTSLGIFVFSGGIDDDNKGLYQNGTECSPIIKIDNVRAVPNK